MFICIDGFTGINICHFHILLPEHGENCMISQSNCRIGPIYMADEPLKELIWERGMSKSLRECTSRQHAPGSTCALFNNNNLIIIIIILFIERHFQLAVRGALQHSNA